MKNIYLKAKFFFVTLGAILVCTAIFYIVVKNKNHAESYNEYGQLTHYKNKIQVNCPVDRKAFVILALGQSNIANHAYVKNLSKHSSGVINWYDSKCYVGSSQLLGASGHSGEYLTLLASKIYEQTNQIVVIVSLGVGGSKILDWNDGLLRVMLVDQINKLTKSFSVNLVIWHQGETDFSEKTTYMQYLNGLKSLSSTLKSYDIRSPIGVVVASRCNKKWDIKNSINKAQHSFISENLGFLAYDADRDLSSVDRMDDLCHLSEKGQLKISNGIFLNLKANGLI